MLDAIRILTNRIRDIIIFGNVENMLKNGNRKRNFRLNLLIDLNIVEFKNKRIIKSF